MKAVSATMHSKLALAVALSTLTLGVASCSGPAAAPTTTTPAAATTAPAAATAPAPAGFALDTAGMRERITKAGLAVLTAEGNVDHYHAHLDVLKDGNPIPVPANIGITISAANRPDGISALHTHDTTGVVHIESPTAGQVFKLGQLLTEWGVLSGAGTPGTGNGPLDGWTVYVNGTKYDAGISDLPLKAHDEVVLSYGTPPAKISAAYEFPPGE